MSEEGIDVIVVNYRTPNDLTRFLASYAVTDKPPGQLFIFNVDPTREDRTTVDVWRQEIPELLVMESKDNCGYAAAVNAVSRYCNREAIAIFNADVVLSQGAMNRCFRELMAHPDWGVLGPRQVDSRGRVTHAGILGQRGSQHTYRAWHARQEWLERNDDEDFIIETVPMVMGSAMFVKKACWDELTMCPEYLAHLADARYARPYGALLPTQLYYEETFLCYHAIEHDWKVVYFGPTTIIHEWHKSIDKNLPQDKEMHMIEIAKLQFNRACDAVHGMPHP